LTRTIPKVFVTRFFQLITARQFAEAERILERLKQKITMSERNRGYFQALYGMLLAQRNNDDRYAFLSNLNLKDKSELQSYRREFQRQSENHLHADYDKGFLSAWADYMRILSKLELPLAPVPNKNYAQKETKIEEAETEKKEKRKEPTDEGTKEAETEIKIEAEKEEIEAVEEAESVEMTEPRQSTLFDFAK
jgi:hypothetical protein